jgi:hypothetical protein
MQDFFNKYTNFITFYGKKIQYKLLTIKLLIIFQQSLITTKEFSSELNHLKKKVLLKKILTASNITIKSKIKYRL